VLGVKCLVFGVRCLVFGVMYTGCGLKMMVCSSRSHPSWNARKLSSNTHCEDRVLDGPASGERAPMAGIISGLYSGSGCKGPFLPKGILSVKHHRLEPRAVQPQRRQPFSLARVPTALAMGRGFLLYGV